MLRMARAWMLLLLLVGLILPVLAEEPAAPVETPGIPILNQTLPNRLLNVGKSYLTGKRITVDYVQRRMDDEEAGVVRLTDSNYKEIVEDGDKEDIYVAILHGDMTHRNSPKYFDAHHDAVKLYTEAIKEKKEFKAADAEDKATELTKDEKALLKHVKWARIDYVDEWKLCARWQIFRPPYLVIITDGGENLRFFSARQFPAKGEVILNYIKSGQWKEIPPWKGMFGPGGRLSFFVDLYIKPQERLAERFGNIPPIVWMLVFGWMTRELTTITTQWFNNREARRAAAPKPTDNKKSREKMEAALKELRAKRAAEEAASGSSAASGSKKENKKRK
ncbi:hypothetical protein BD324DRAFT_652717 [Kockovaella imperatae]|uniref:Thioredoxin-like fold domain-containing protein n=1 Tax=Kockovaella imperatae TaxID=4999 RepID=A0A1Y1UBT8_9TREE|nr:hypothetical protein BD324DRAFT_652717 [Kockovaella imperatae]ORX34994.1 hypothetical protein BD324DRAFT_652717 [Kockovaella imperatae]